MGKLKHQPPRVMFGVNVDTYSSTSTWEWEILEILTIKEVDFTMKNRMTKVDDKSRNDMTTRHDFGSGSRFLILWQLGQRVQPLRPTQPIRWLIHPKNVIYGNVQRVLGLFWGFSKDRFRWVFRGSIHHFSHWFEKTIWPHGGLSEKTVQFFPQDHPKSINRKSKISVWTRGPWGRDPHGLRPKTMTHQTDLWRDNATLTGPPKWVDPLHSDIKLWLGEVLNIRWKASVLVLDFHQFHLNLDVITVPLLAKNFQRRVEKQRLGFDLETFWQCKSDRDHYGGCPQARKGPIWPTDFIGIQLIKGEPTS